VVQKTRICTADARKPGTESALPAHPEWSRGTQVINGFVMNALSSPISPAQTYGLAAIDEGATAIADLEHTA